MTVDRKRLRELAEATAGRGYCSIASSDLFALLDALEAQPPTDDARDAARHRFIRARCVVSLNGRLVEDDAEIDAAIAERTKEQSK